MKTDYWKYVGVDKTYIEEEQVIEEVEIDPELDYEYTYSNDKGIDYEYEIMKNEPHIIDEDGIDITYERFLFQRNNNLK